MKYPLKRPVIFFIYRRPEFTQRVFERIAQAQPSSLFIVADGPKTEDERERCQAARAITEQISWECDVYRDYADHNLGLQQRVASGIDWAFTYVDTAIVLEDDTLPELSFFRFCDELLDYYADDERIFHISGNNFQPPEHSVETSYFFSQYPHYWGWATWRRAWLHYDVTMQTWINAPDKAVFKPILNDPEGWFFWHRRWNRVVNKQIDSYSYPWIFACLLHGAIAIEPAVNLVTNIGFGADSTHTIDPDDPLANYPTGVLDFPLKHPETIDLFRAADSYKVERFFYAH